jgi:endonuclease YncB( thermonuclease family)
MGVSIGPRSAGAQGDRERRVPADTPPHSASQPPAGGPWVRRLQHGVLVCAAAALVAACSGGVSVGGNGGGGIGHREDPGAGVQAPGTTPGQQRAASGASGERGRVTNVVDGDTVDVEGVGRVRVIGIDTPERGSCGYESATLAMVALVQGREVVAVAGAVDDADRYGRRLRYLDVDGRDAGLSLIESGWAIARYDSRDGYGRHPREDVYVVADQASRDLGCYPDDDL